MFEASDGESNVHLKCDNTGEARPEEIVFHLNTTTTTTTSTTTIPVETLVASESIKPYEIAIINQILFSTQPSTLTEPTTAASTSASASTRTASIIETITTAKKKPSRLSTKRSKPASMKQFISTIKPTISFHKPISNSSLQNNVKLMTLKSIITMYPTSATTNPINTNPIVSTTYISTFISTTASTMTTSNITAAAATPTTQLALVKSFLNTTFKSSNKFKSTSHKKLTTFGNQTKANNRKTSLFTSQSTVVDETKSSK